MRRGSKLLCKYCEKDDYFSLFSFETPCTFVKYIKNHYLTMSSGNGNLFATLPVLVYTGTLSSVKPWGLHSSLIFGPSNSTLKSGKLLSHNSSGILYTPVPLSFSVKSLCRLLEFFNSAINMSRRTSKPDPKKKVKHNFIQGLNPTSTTMMYQKKSRFAIKTKIEKLIWSHLTIC